MYVCFKRMYVFDTNVCLFVSIYVAWGGGGSEVWEYRGEGSRLVNRPAPSHLSIDLLPLTCQ